MKNGGKLFGTDSWLEDGVINIPGQRWDAKCSLASD